jgi:tRNA threonylcarbamoyl adenosine modification protein YeaZ
LGFDTSAAHCAAAVSSGSRILAYSCKEMAKGQAEHLFPLLEDALVTAGVSWRDIDAIGVGTGPGNFTGIRIAVASARGLSMSLRLPAIGISAFQALAHDAKQLSLLTVVDGRRGNVHFQTFGDVGKGANPETLPVEKLVDRFSGQPLCVIGHRADEIAQRVGPMAVVGASLPIAQATALAAAARLGAPAPPPKPLYVRPADAAPPRELPPTLLP